jgi:hypothetical protein
MPGILWGGDYESLWRSAETILERFAYAAFDRINFVEIGIDAGLTSRSLTIDIRNWMKSHGFPRTFRYFGVDAFANRPEFICDEFVFISKFSHLASSELPSELHWCWIDGCHCYNCVKRDLEIYAGKMAVGGHLLFHDASPGMQGRDPQTYAGMLDYHDMKEAAKGIQVRRVLDEVMAKRADFKLVQAAPSGQSHGGVEVYQKVRA